MNSLARWVVRLLSRWPLVLLHGLGWVVGWAVFLLSAKYRRRLLAHAAQAGYPRSVAIASVGEAGKMSAELPRLWFGPPVPLEWEGEACVQAALDSGGGLLFFTPHLGCFEVTAQAYAQRFGARQPVTVLFRPARQPWLRDLMLSARERPHLHTAPTNFGGVKQLMKALKSGQAVGLLPDQVPPDGQGVWAPFFGREAYTMTLSARLAQTAGVQPLLIWGERLPWGRGYRMHVRPLSEVVGADALAGDAAQAARLLNQVMETLVRECPAQYLWSYNRYKRHDQV